MAARAGASATDASLVTVISFPVRREEAARA